MVMITSAFLICERKPFSDAVSPVTSAVTRPIFFSFTFHSSAFSEHSALIGDGSARAPLTSLPSLYLQWRHIDAERSPFSTVELLVHDDFQYC